MSVKDWRFAGSYVYVDGVPRDVWLETQSNSGQTLRVHVQPGRIDAYRTDKPIIRTTRFENGEESVSFNDETTEKLAEHLSREPVMSIWYRGLGPDGPEWSVDFEAGFQRGLFSYQDREALTQRLSEGLPRIETRDPWLAWIGLNPDSELVSRWLDEGKA